jgi:signal transduction histidine kinase
MPATAARPDGDVPSPENLLQEYKELRERFQRTTNALGSAAHDLKTPLSILNGYVDLLHSEKLGPLSARQREVAAHFSIRFSQAGTRNLEPAGKFFQVHASKRNRVAARRAAHVGTPGGGTTLGLGTTASERGSA